MLRDRANDRAREARNAWENVVDEYNDLVQLEPTGTTQRELAESKHKMAAEKFKLHEKLPSGGLRTLFGNQIPMITTPEAKLVLREARDNWEQFAAVAKKFIHLPNSLYFDEAVKYLPIISYKNYMGLYKSSDYNAVNAMKILFVKLSPEKLEKVPEYVVMRRAYSARYNAREIIRDSQILQ